MVVGLIVVIPVQHDLAAQIDHGLDLDLRCRQRHHDSGCNAAVPGRQCDPLGVVAGRCADDAAPGGRFRQMRDLVVGAADLE